jgi:glycosyltransferase involved in cell wall biosynthesis
MFNGKKVIVIIPAYNTARTVAKEFHLIPRDIVDDIVFMDNASTDETLIIAESLGIEHIIRQQYNTGYGGNAKAGFRKALELGADIVIVLHSDYQYTPLLIPSMVGMIANGVYPVVLGSRMLGKGTLRGGMPRYKFVFNRVLTSIQNMLMNERLSEYHTGYRAISREVLLTINWENNSNDWVFDNQEIAQILWHGFEIGEVTCPTKYFDEASSITFKKSLLYGLGCLQMAVDYRLCKWGLKRSRIFDKSDIHRYDPKPVARQEVKSIQVLNPA